MSFVLSKLLWPLVSPGNFLVLVLTAGTILLFSRRHARLGRRFVVGAAFGFLLITFTPLSSMVALPLEERFPKTSLPDQVDGIIMLGGGVNPHLSLDRNEPSLNNAAERVLAFADLVRRFPAARHVFTGGTGQLFAQEATEDVPLRAALVQAGIDPDSVTYENQSRNTWENAVFSQRMVQPRPGETWLLVTSAMHMPRAVGIFRTVGWPVIPYPVDYRTRPGARPYTRFDLDLQMETLRDSVREWIGLVAYRAMGRTDSLFPGP
ncbi:YdcF family protein [Azospirillum rugosum]|uniref:Uncharacterized SAM-binding protein YcdF (DUF218 family) n=1 Tax=Azospirillum rugosum TaxID=416170 RepID=A0ABS4SS16_9PROT|nr:YdcF family protein [Azospirillum rugosum]MBP2294742.1 uncharacterized SAM-binding protein YcdF (DUF218 family) [Azospirillum rugosum]MDQ0527969.1 uncharacterized SAM-binding protein YcdF (DUF218 family) [Azospirillum rugosum]